MNKLRNDQKELVAKFDERKQELLKDLLENDSPYIVNYGVLMLALEDKIIAISEKEVEEFYGVSIDELTTVDSMIAQLVSTLNIYFDNVKEEYLSAGILDSSQPEVAYLTKLVSEIA